MSNVFPLPRVVWPQEPVTPHVASADDWLARISVEAPRVPWDAFLSRYFTWEQGEHVGIIGPTGQGKTTLMRAIMPLQPYVVVFATKPRDTNMDRIIASGYVRMDRWESIPVDRAPRRVLWPDATKLGSEANQKRVFTDAMAKIYREMGWTVVLDEGSFLTNELSMRSEIKTYLMQGRSLGISLVFATQRPAFIPLEVYDQSTHLFLFRDPDRRNLDRLREISWSRGQTVMRIVANLEKYQALYVNTREETMVRTRVPAQVFEGR